MSVVSGLGAAWKNGHMRIVFAGTPEFAVPSLRALHESSHTVSGVITRADAPLGRKRVMTPSPVAAAAEELALPIYKTNRLDEAATDWVAAQQPDLGVIVAYGGLVRDPLLSLPRLGWINLHFSDLPRYRGAAPVQRALMDGETTLGVTVFRLVEALDAGAVLTRDQFEVAPGTTAGQALTKLASAGTDAVLLALDLLARDADAGEPQIGDSSYAHKLSRDDGRLQLAEPTARVLAHWAGVTPEPGAFVLHEGESLKILELGALPTDTDAANETDAPGTVELCDGKACLLLRDGVLELLRVQPAGKPAMNGADWLRGRGGRVVLQ